MLALSGYSYCLAKAWLSIAEAALNLFKNKSRNFKVSMLISNFWSLQPLTVLKPFGTIRSIFNLQSIFVSQSFLWRREKPQSETILKNHVFDIRFATGCISSYYVRVSVKSSHKTPWKWLHCTQRKSGWKVVLKLL